MNALVIDFATFAKSRRHLEKPSGIIDSERLIEFFSEFKGNSSNWASYWQSSITQIFPKKIQYLFLYKIDVGSFMNIVFLQSLFNFFISLVFEMAWNFGLIFRNNISEASKLIKMPSEGISWVEKWLISGADEASSFDQIMSFIECWSCEIFIYRMDIKSLERINWSNGMLPYITNNVKELSCFEPVDRVRREPIFQINVSYWLIFPVCLIRRKLIPDSKVLAFSWKSIILASLPAFPIAKSLSFEIIDFGRPVPRHLSDCLQCS